MKDNEESHPSFAMAGVYRVSQGGAGASMFDSEIRHNHYVVLKIMRATRKRDLHRDWIFGGQQIIEVSMSMSQWGALVSSFNTEGVPVTLAWLDGRRIPEPPYEPRLAYSTDEVKEAGNRAFERIKAAAAKVKEAIDGGGKKAQREAMHNLDLAIEQAPGNMAFAAESLTEHVENVVGKARADIEAMIVDAAERAQLQLDPSSFPALPSGRD